MPWVEKMNIVREALDFIGELFRQRHAIFQLARQDFSNRYLGSMLGLIWAFIQPLVMVVILWFVIGVVFNPPTTQGVPFVVWLLVGMAAWSFFSDAVSMATGVFQEYAFLVKKTQFKIAILPIVKILSALAVHGVFLCIVIVILLATRVPVSWYWLQIPYYVLALLVFILGLSWITASLNVFVRDVAYIVGVLLQFGFWLTPIFWDPTVILKKHQLLLKLLMLNPLFYIVEGYRKSLIGQTPFWADGWWCAYFWLLTLVMLIIGVAAFKKLKPHFADVL